MIPYKRYKSDLIRLGASHIPTESEYMRQYRQETEEAFEPLTIRPKRDARKISASLENHIKVVKDIKETRAKMKRKPKDKKEPIQRKQISEEEISEGKRRREMKYYHANRDAINERRREKRKLHPELFRVPAEDRKYTDTSIMTVEEAKEHRKTQRRISQAKWREKNREKELSRNRDYKQTDAYKQREAEKARERRAMKKEALSYQPTITTTITN